MDNIIYAVLQNLYIDFIAWHYITPSRNVMW